MTDLNTLFPADSNLLATMANSINSAGHKRRLSGGRGEAVPGLRQLRLVLASRSKPSDKRAHQFGRGPVRTHPTISTGLTDYARFGCSPKLNDIWVLYVILTRFILALGIVPHR